MSAYTRLWCKDHGEWDMDLDSPGECPKCIELGMTEIQQLRARLVFLEAALASPQPGDEQTYYFMFEDAKKKLVDWAEHEDLAPHKGCHCRMCITLESADSMKAAWNTACEELTNLKSAFARLREDRDMHSEMRQRNFKKMLELQKGKLELIVALKLLVTDVQDYETWQRPCYALDKAKELLERLVD